MPESLSNDSRVRKAQYDKSPKMEMVTIVDKNAYKRLMDYICKADPKPLVTVYSVSDMRYQPKVGK